MRTLIAIVLSSFIISNAIAQPLAIAESGQPCVEIVVDGNAPSAVAFAAAELEKHLKLITGASFIIKNEIAKDRSQIVLGLTDLPDFAADRAKLKGTDGYAIRQKGGQLYIFADCPKGVLNGVYKFIVGNSDLIWPRPGGEMVIYTPDPNMKAAQINVLDIPAFKLRGFHWNAPNDPELELWNARMCGYPPVNSERTPRAVERREQIGIVNGYLNYFGGGHNLMSFWLPVERFGKEHPEYYMMVEGERQVKNSSNPCTSNSGTLEALIGRFREELPKIPQFSTVVAVQIADQNLCCECPECIKPITLPDGTVIDKDHEAFRSTQFFIFFNKAAKAAREIRSDLILQQFGYYFLSVPPLVDVEPNVIINFCPYVRNLKAPLTAPGGNEKWKKRTDGWAKRTPNLKWREYYYCRGVLFPRPIADIAVQDFRYIRELGVQYATSDGGVGDSPRWKSKNYPASELWDTCAMELWTVCRIFWDPNLDPQTIRREYLQRAYREAAPAMREYFDAIREAWLNDPAPSSFNDDPYRSAAYYIHSKKLTEKCRAALAKAEKDAVHPLSRQLVQDNRKVFEKWMAAADTSTANELTVPSLKCDSFPAFGQAVWESAARFPTLKLMNNNQLNSKYQADCRVFHNGKDFYIGIEIKKDPATLYARNPAGAKHDVFPNGDHVELFFANERDGYYHLAYDYHGNRYDAMITDAAWNTRWEVKTEKTADGWRSIARIPMTSINYEMLKNNKLRFLLFVANFGKEGQRELASWGGGITHSANSFGELTVELE